MAAAWGVPSGRRPGRYRLLTAAVIGLVGVGLLLGAARADEYLHRGVESGDEVPYVHHLGGRVLGVNHDFRGLPHDEVERVAEDLEASGIRLVRQRFDWADIEREQGTLDWSDYDPIVETLAARDIEILAVLSHAPEWARQDGRSSAPDAPPDDVEDFRVFVEVLSSRYAGSVAYLQIWDRPNLETSWGNQRPDPGTYTKLLAAAASAAHQRDPAMHVLMAELAPRGDQEGMSDLAFLRGAYRAGAAPFFDAVAIALSGSSASPFDRWVDPERLNMSRAVLFREMMVEANDAETPVWATSYRLSDETSSGALGSEAFITGGLLRAREEWPWMGPVILGTAEHASSLIIPHITLPPGEDDRLLGNVSPPGMVPVDANSIVYEGSWNDLELGETASKGSTEHGAAITVRFYGTGVSAILRAGPTAGPVRVTLDGRPLPGTEATEGATEIDLFRFAAIDTTIPLAFGLDDAVHELRIALAPEENARSGPVEITFGGIIVSHEVPSDWPVTLLSGAGLGALWYAAREALYVLALGAGWLRRYRQVDLGPPLSGWEPRRPS
ncbi:MAG TPA: hypothetical protein VGR16_15535 [Thermomicrobiales bacterium]|nr:hypothetical protein [Thermomicrobiales bacterium]